MCGETVNNIITYTTNPKNRYLAAGGSSGGEGALIALKGSPLGFGTDIGGSIRIPAAFNGLYGIKPSGGRLPYEGMANSLDGQNSILSVVGPLATSVGALKLAFKSLLSQEPWLYDPLVADIPWREEYARFGQNGEKMTFAVLKSDGAVRCHPPVNRAIDIAVQAARSLGHEVIEWDPPSHSRGLEIVVCPSNPHKYISNSMLTHISKAQNMVLRRWRRYTLRFRSFRRTNVFSNCRRIRNSNTRVYSLPNRSRQCHQTQIPKGVYGLLELDL